MSMSSKIGALLFKHHQSEAKKGKKKKHAPILAMPTPRLTRVQNGPPISPHIALDVPVPPRSILVQRFEAVPDNLPTVTAPPPGTEALEEPDTIESTWVEGDSGATSSPNWCRSLCCSPCE